MFERVGIEQKIRENMKDDQEFEMLLGEIPHATSLNIHYPQNNVHHVNGGHGHFPFVKQTMNGMICAKYDDDPSSHYKYTCVSPVSGFSLQSGGSSSSLLSGGHLSSDNGSPPHPPLEELKVHMPYGSSDHPNRFLLDFKVPHSVGKMSSENFIDELNLSRSIGRMCLSDEQENFLVELHAIRPSDHSIRAVDQISLEKYGVSGNYRKSFSDYGGPPSSVSRSLLHFEGEISSELSELHCEYRPDNVTSPQYSNGCADGLYSQRTFSSNLGNFPCSRMKEQPSNYYQRRVPVSNLASSFTEPSVADTLFYSQQNGMRLNGEWGALNFSNMPYTIHQSPNMGGESILQGNSPMLNGSARAPLDIRIPQAGESFASEESLIIQGEGLNYVVNRGFGHQRAHNCQGSLHEITAGKPREKRSEQNGHSQFPGIYENDRNARLHGSLPLKWKPLAEAQGYIFLLAKDQHGCRFLQRMFDEGTPQDVQIIFSEIIDHVAELMMNPFGNYLMQKLLEVCDEAQRTQILLVITKDPGQLVRISLNTHGTRVVQKLIATLETRKQVSLVISALEPGFLALIKDPNGNHVVQRCLECLSDEDNKFIFVAAAKYCVDIATHQNGCCVLQQCINCSSGEHRDNLIAEISANALLLAQDAFGNYVVQLILDLKIPSVTSMLISQFEGNFVHLSRQKFSSHVVEKCLTVFEDEVRAKIIHELLSSSHFELLLQDPHANYVIQKALRLSEGSLYNLLVDTIESHKATSRNSPYSKRIFSQKLLKK